jgi:asparagine synthase (glutamine-hydrolysing)
MCGIVAAYGPNPGRQLEAALGAIRHRGPDSEGIQEGPGWAMGIRRLAIIDVAGGDQPIANEDESIWVVVNGEIYNHNALRRDLVARGHVFRTKSDAEVVVHLYEEHGERFVEHLQGMFGLFLATPDGCFAARDRVGIKPLYLARTSDSVYVASEIRSLLELPGVRRPEIDAARLADYFLFRYVPEPHTAFTGIDRFPAGHLLKLTPGGDAMRRYWQLDAQPPFRGSFDDAVADCEARLDRIVDMHLMSERPVGVFLSGGLDSSVLAALAVRRAQHPLVALTASFPGSDLDEAAHARRVAQHLKVEHHLIDLKAVGVDDLRRSVEVVEDLVADPALMPFIDVSRRARENLTVALVGEGSDETNVGYKGFLWMQKMLARRRLTRLVPLLPRTGDLATKLGHPALDDIDFLARYTNVGIPVDDYPPFLEGLPSAVERIRGEIHRLTDRARGLSTLGRNRLFRIEGWMKDDLLIKVDKTTMAASIEARVPFLDHTYVEWSFGIPDALVLRNGETKAVLRAVARKLLPPEIAGRRQHGLVVPMRDVLGSIGSDTLQPILRHPEALWRRIFPEKPTLALFDRHHAGDTTLSFFIYQVVNSEFWRERWLSPR